jgi:F0F1-type ATP synthase membrane subunit b/b'
VEEAEKKRKSARRKADLIILKSKKPASFEAGYLKDF